MGAVFGLAANECFIGFDNAALTAKRGGFGLHGFADAMGHEPCGFIGDFEIAAKLAGADAFLAAVHQGEGHQPLVERDFAVFKDGADRNRELLTARIAHVEAGASRLAADLRVVLRVATVRANRTFRPVKALQMLAGFVGIAVNGIGDVHHYGLSLPA